MEVFVKMANERSIKKIEQVEVTQFERLNLYCEIGQTIRNLSHLERDMGHCSPL